MSIMNTMETERGCGYRKEGGLYVVAGGPSVSSEALPLPLAICPTCHGGIKQSRGWTWIEPAPLFLEHDVWDDFFPFTKNVAMMSHALRVRAGLLWIGEKFYKTPGEFLAEGMEQGVSRRITALPNDFIVGQTRIFFAHSRAMPGWDDEIGEFTDDGEDQGPGIFGSFVAERIDYVVKSAEITAYEACAGVEDDLLKETAEHDPIAKVALELRRKEARGITLVNPTRVDAHGQHVDENGNLIGTPLTDLAQTGQ